MTDTVGVLGAGLMGREIALVFALAGHPVILIDLTQDALDAARARLAEIVGKAVARGLMPADAPAALDRIATATDPAAVAPCAFVTEAVYEDEGVKAQVLAAADTAMAPGAILATNTSTIPITALAAHVRAERRAQFIGTHYFSPVSRMRLVEVIPGHFTAPATVEATRARMAAIGKTPVTVKDVPGFAVNRLLHVLMIEAVRLVEEGVATPEDIDIACRLGLGHPMGPFELMDATTSSLCLQAQEIMFDAYGERFRPRPLLKARVRAGLTGGRGRPGWRTA